MQETRAADTRTREREGTKRTDKRKKTLTHTRKQRGKKKVNARTKGGDIELTDERNTRYLHEREKDKIPPNERIKKKEDSNVHMKTEKKRELTLAR